MYVVGFVHKGIFPGENHFKVASLSAADVRLAVPQKVPPCCCSYVIFQVFLFCDPMVY